MAIVFLVLWRIKARTARASLEAREAMADLSDWVWICISLKVTVDGMVETEETEVAAVLNLVINSRSDSREGGGEVVVRILASDCGVRARMYAYG